MNPDLSILIVSWNTRLLLDQCLAAIYAHPPARSFEVLVVDNCSQDGSAEMVKTEYPQVRLIENSANVGFGSANNQAIHASSGRHVLLLNSDTQVLPGALETLAGYLDATPEAGAAGARLLNGDGSLQESCHPSPTLGSELWRMFHLDRLRPVAVYSMERWDTRQTRYVDVLKGACILLRREVIDQVGVFDEDFFMYSEEVDLCYRIGKGGWKLAWVPEAQVVHYEGQSTRQMASEMFIHLYQGKIRYFRKHYGPAAVTVYKAILLAATLSRLLLTPVAFLERPAQRQRHLTLSRQYRRLLAALPSL